MKKQTESCFPLMEANNLIVMIGKQLGYYAEKNWDSKLEIIVSGVNSTQVLLANMLSGNTFKG